VVDDGDHARPWRDRAGKGTSERADRRRREQRTGRGSGEIGDVVGVDSPSSSSFNGCDAEDHGEAIP
jgi:hypothetical protein